MNLISTGPCDCTGRENATILFLYVRQDTNMQTEEEELGKKGKQQEMTEIWSLQHLGPGPQG